MDRKTGLLIVIASHRDESACVDTLFDSYYFRPCQLHFLTTMTTLYTITNESSCSDNPGG
jgi:hypothetical protein